MKRHCLLTTPCPFKADKPGCDKWLKGHLLDCPVAEMIEDAIEDAEVDRG